MTDARRDEAPALHFDAADDSPFDSPGFFVAFSAAGLRGRIEGNSSVQLAIGFEEINSLLFGDRVDPPAETNRGE